MNDRVLGEAMESLHGYNPTKATADAAHQHECEWPSHRGKEDFGCKCSCGAVRHLIGWQTVKVLDPVSPFTQYEYRVMVGGGRGGRADGILYEGRDLDTVKYWLREREKDNPWVVRRPIVPWERVEDVDA